MNATTTDHQDPFAPVQKVSVSSLKQYPNAYSVRVEDDSADKGWREVGVSPPGHLLVTNQELYCMADEIASRSPFDWRGVRLFFDGRRFGYALSTNDVFEDVGGQEALCAGLLFQTSYDGSWATGCRLFGYRLVSTCGLLHGPHFGHLQFEHALSSDDWDEELHRGLGYANGASEKLESFGEGARRLKKRAIDSTDLAALRRGPLSGLPSPLWGQLLDKYLSGSPRTAWDLLTEGAALLWNETDRPSMAKDFARIQSLTEGVTEAVPGDGVLGEANGMA